MKINPSEGKFVDWSGFVDSAKYDVGWIVGKLCGLGKDVAPQICTTRQVENLVMMLGY